jgi:hypothetical protein
MALDFEKLATRPDIAGRRVVPRPGFFLSSVGAGIAATSGREFAAFCGNNVGYWPNQLLVVGGEVVLKCLPSIFFRADDGVLRFDQHGIGFGASGFSAWTAELSLQTEPTCYTTDGLVPTPDLEAGVSGYPLVWEGASVWDRFPSSAWDPKLLLTTPSPGARPHGVRTLDLSKGLKEGQPLVRHAMTILGLGDDHVGVVVVEEGTARSSGCTVAEAADTAHRLGWTHAIVLGAKGDAQLVTSEGPSGVRPLVSAHDRHAAAPTVGAGPSGEWLERRIPSFCVLEKLESPS